MNYRVFDYEMDKIISETSNEKEAHIFARMYSAGSENRNSCNVWVYISESAFDDSEAIAFYASGARFDRKK